MYKAIRYGVICVLLSACGEAEMTESDTRAIADQNDSTMWYALQGDWEKVYLYDASSGLYLSPWGDPYCHITIHPPRVSLVHYLNIDVPPEYIKETYIALLIAVNE